MKLMRIEMILFTFGINQVVLQASFIHQQPICGVDFSNFVQLSKTSNALCRAADEIKIEMSGANSKNVNSPGL